MSTDVLSTRVVDGIAIVALGSPRRIYFDAEMGDALTAALDGYAGDPLERNLFLKLCISDAGLARMRSYEAANITSPARSIEGDETEVNRG